MNVIGSRPDGWWRDRAGAMSDLVEALRGFRDETGDEVAVVFDGRERPEVIDSGGDEVTVRFADRSGPDAADDRIAELLDADPDPASVTVVTSDRALEERARARGAEVVGGGRFRSQLEERR